MSALISNAIPVAQLTLAAAAISTSYAVAGTFTRPVVAMWIISTLDQAVQVSFDGGVTDDFAVPAGNTVPVIIPIEFKNFNTVFPMKPIAVKEIGNPTTGSIYFCGISAQLP